MGNKRSPVHDDVIKWKHFPRYWPFVRGIHRSPGWPVNSLHKDQWRGGLVFSLIGARINGWVNNGEASDLRRHRTHYDVNVMARTWKWMQIMYGHCVNTRHFTVNELLQLAELWVPVDLISWQRKFLNTRTIPIQIKICATNVLVYISYQVGMACYCWCQVGHLISGIDFSMELQIQNIA